MAVRVRAIDVLDVATMNAAALGALRSARRAGRAGAGLTDRHGTVAWCLGPVGRRLRALRVARPA